MSLFKKSRRQAPPPYRKELYGILFFALGFFITLSLISYHPSDPGFHAAAESETIANWGGILGAYLADFLLTGFGLCAYCLAGLSFLLSGLKFKGETLEMKFRGTFYVLMIALCLSILLQLHFPQAHVAGQTFAGGGILGLFFGNGLVRWLNRIGAELVAVTGLLFFFILATKIKLSSLVINIFRLLRYFGSHCLQWGRVSLERSRRGLVWGALWLKGQFVSIFAREEGEDDEDEEEESAVKIHAPKAPPPPKVIAAEEAGDNEPKIYERIDQRKKQKPDEQLKFLKISGSGFTPPPLSLLDSEGQKTVAVDEKNLKKSAYLLEKKLLDYDVEGHVTEIHPGPVVTMYEFEPKPGTKVSKIVNLESDLSLTMGGRSIRIVPHLPGKAAVGIEIPNHERETVWLKEIIGSETFQKIRSPLALGLGRDIKGRPMAADLTRMPHLLIAGATGSGKSVGINGMLLSIIYKSSPEEVRLILVDPKRLELNVYAEIPHLLLPVVTEPKKAVVAMKWAVKEMERRYRLLADVGTRNINTYNEKVAKEQIPLISQEEAKEKMEKNPDAVCHVGKLYYLVIVIDELADLMMVASAEFEETITRLAQMARASGIHLILATQRPSVDVITGLIKANFPARISYKVSARHDSRTILDSMGAESLLGSGDMLFMSPSSTNLVRIHGALVTESEIARVVSHLKGQGQPVFDPNILEAATQAAASENDGPEEAEDEMYDQAVSLVAESRQASISMIQRRLRIGFNRAARMIERMEAEGVIGPQEGAKPRQVLITSLEG